MKQRIEHVDIVLVDLDENFDGSVLRDDEQLRASKFRFEVDRRRWIASRAALRNILSERVGVGPRDLVLNTSPHGKLALPDQGLEFNLSHSDRYALIALSDAGAVGVDIERARDDVDAVRLAERFFSKSEANVVATAGERTLEVFYSIWTQKEALVKALGEGLSIELDSFDVDAVSPEGGLLTQTLDAGEWIIKRAPVPEGYFGAVAFSRTATEMT